jgi:hypothetical protein
MIYKNGYAIIDNDAKEFDGGDFVKLAYASTRGLFSNAKDISGTTIVVKNVTTILIPEVPIKPFIPIQITIFANAAMVM